MCNDIWTNSRLKTYQACPMKERFRYRDCLVPIGRRDALNIGTAVHRGIETWSVDEALNALEFGFPSNTEEAEAQEIMRGTVEAMLNGYFNCYRIRSYYVIENDDGGVTLRFGDDDPMVRIRALEMENATEVYLKHRLCVVPWRHDDQACLYRRQERAAGVCGDYQRQSEVRHRRTQCGKIRCGCHRRREHAF